MMGGGTAPAIYKLLMKIAAAVSLVAVGLTACSPPPHVRLEAPAPTASEAERIAAYERLFARADARTALVQNGQVTHVSQDYLILGDGTRVHHPDDLIPVVPAGSPTARHAADGKASVDRARPWLTAAAVSFTGSWLVSPVVGVAVGGEEGIIAGAATFGTLAIATIAFMFTAVAKGREFDGQRASAFATYDSDLRARLQLCADGTKVRACEAAPLAPTAAPAAVDVAAPPAPPAPATPAPTAP
jgi:hypothetical protein